MDNNIFELWGNIFLTAARGQKQMENAGKWMKGGFYDMPDSLTGINAIISSSTEYLKIFNMTNENFLKSTKEYLSLMELVPKKDYDSLLEEFEDLKKRTEDKSSGKVDKYLNEELSLQTQNLRSFEELMRKQTEQFQNLLTNFTKFINQKQTTPSKEDLTEKEEKKSSQVRKRPPAFSSKRPSGTTAPKR